MELIASSTFDSVKFYPELFLGIIFQNPGGMQSYLLNFKRGLNNRPENISSRPSW